MTQVWSTVPACIWKLTFQFLFIFFPFSYCIRFMRQADSFQRRSIIKFPIFFVYYINHKFDQEELFKNSRYLLPLNDRKLDNWCLDQELIVIGCQLSATFFRGWQCCGYRSHTHLLLTRNASTWIHFVIKQDLCIKSTERQIKSILIFMFS